MAMSWTGSVSRLLLLRRVVLQRDCRFAAREHIETLLVGLRKLAAQMRHFLILISHSEIKN
jgi:hypothetical protein